MKLTREQVDDIMKNNLPSILEGLKTEMKEQIQRQSHFCRRKNGREYNCTAC